MQAAVIAYRNGTLEAREQDDVWTVRLASLEARARYLDLALVKLLGNASEAHCAAARLLSELADVVDEGTAAFSPLAAPVPRGEPGRTPGHELWRRAQLLGLRALAFAVIASLAFMLTTWLTVLH
jgi:hypothetical protein